MKSKENFSATPIVPIQYASPSSAPRTSSNLSIHWTVRCEEDDDNDDDDDDADADADADDDDDDDDPVSSTQTERSSSRRECHLSRSSLS
jgi:hypothetical protein